MGSNSSPNPPLSVLKTPIELPEPASEFSLRDYWRVLHARRGTIAWAALLSLVAALAYNYVTTPTYQATVTLQIDREERNIAEMDENYRQLPEQPDYLETQYNLKVGIRLTQVAPRCSMPADGRLPSEPDRVRGPF